MFDRALERSAFNSKSSEFGDIQSKSDPQTSK